MPVIREEQMKVLELDSMQQLKRRLSAHLPMFVAEQFDLSALIERIPIVGSI